MRKIVSRFVYRLLLWLHPAWFQHQFGAEMLWIFDQEPGAYLLFDGAISLLRQRCRVQNDPGQLSITAGAMITDPGISPLRLLQGAVSSSAILLCFLLLLGHHNPLSPSVRWPEQMACCTLTLPSISQVDVVCKRTAKIP
jgi:hypothetical protein